MHQSLSLAEKFDVNWTKMRPDILGCSQTISHLLNRILSYSSFTKGAKIIIYLARCVDAWNISVKIDRKMSDNLFAANYISDQDRIRRTVRFLINVITAIFRIVSDLAIYCGTIDHRMKNSLIHN